ncbi:MAG: hypothetical protein OEY63_04330, partial [Gemmatimonadota bacterium]|nr:hypothetical protein [Gemmatimonadota bacterium]
QVPPALAVVAVADSAPVVSIPVPGQDTLAQTNLRQLLVVDARDDHGLTEMVVSSRRVTRTGFAHEPVLEPITLPEETTDRAVVQWMLDLAGRGFLPGDTAYYYVSVSDNAPNTRTTSTKTFSLLIPSSNEMREAVRDQADQLVQSADSIAKAQEELQRQTEEMARRQEAQRSGDSGDDQLDFETAQEAAELNERQQELAEQAKTLAEALEDLQDAGWEAGLTDPEWHERMQELSELMEDAVTPEMMESMDELQQALEDLDPDAVREALEKMAEAQQQMEEQLERNRELMERAALESAMTTLAEDAEELSSRQEQWQNQLEHQQGGDSALAAEENRLAEEAEKLEENLERLNAQTEQRDDAPSLESERMQAESANQEMRRAAEQTSSGDRQQAQQSGENAQQQLESLSQELQNELEQMREEWREEVLGMMDRALVETADLAERQVSVAERLLRGETSDDVRGEQTTVRDGLDRVVENLQDAAGKNALVSPELGTALGFSRLQMTEALQELQEAMPNSRQAGQRAAQALDGLNQVAYALAQSRSSLQNSQSGSGMAEMMEQMAEMAEQQQSMTQDASAMMPMMSSGTEELLQQLQQLADQQRSLGEELERMDAEGGPASAEELAEEALEVAAELEAGRLDRTTVERQERLFRRLLDAGRTLRNEDEEEEESEERESETADPTNIRPPEAFDTGVLNDSPLVPYPSWEQLRRFTPDERRLILDYFRRLNDARRRP